MTLPLSLLIIYSKLYSSSFDVYVVAFIIVFIHFVQNVECVVNFTPQVRIFTFMLKFKFIHSSINIKIFIKRSSTCNQNDNIPWFLAAVNIHDMNTKDRRHYLLTAVNHVGPRPS